MIIVRLLGGMGNQMFQYAAGRRLSEHHGVPLKLDVHGFDTVQEVTPRKYELNHFNVQQEFALPEEVERLAMEGKSFLGRLSTMLPYRFHSHLTERGEGFDSRLLNAGKNVYLEGWWGSERYFSDIQEIIRREFTVRYPMEGLSVALADEILSTTSVSVHVRRGDFASDPRTRSFHGLLPLEYYVVAADIIAERVKRPHFLVFSDDPQWAHDHLALRHPVTFISHNGVETAYDDLRLMSLCRHHVIANSTFSWWGAWLNGANDKLVIAPKRWLSRSTPPGLIPESWICL